MKFPVYRFSEVLRALRNESGLTVLQAAERIGYGNYERWESGKTKVGPEYLQVVADVFGIEATSGCWPTPGSSTATRRNRAPGSSTSRPSASSASFVNFRVARSTLESRRIWRPGRWATGSWRSCV